MIDRNGSGAAGHGRSIVDRARRPKSGQARPIPVVRNYGRPVTRATDHNSPADLAAIQVSSRTVHSYHVPVPFERPSSVTLLQFLTCDHLPFLSATRPKHTLRCESLHAERSAILAFDPVGRPTHPVRICRTNASGIMCSGQYERSAA